MTRQIARKISVGIVGTPRVGKSSILVSSLKAFKRENNRFGIPAPYLPLRPTISKDYPEFVVADRENRTTWTGLVKIDRQVHEFVINDFRGGFISEYFEGEEGATELPEILSTCQLLILVLAPHELTDPRGVKWVLDGMIKLCRAVILIKKKANEPEPMIALAYSKTDDYGTEPDRNARIVSTSEAKQAQRAIVEEGDKARKPAEAEEAWKHFLKALRPDTTKQWLLEQTRPIWETIGKETRFFNGYMVAAEPENLLWEPWCSRGGLQLFADFFEYLKLHCVRWNWFRITASVLVGLFGVLLFLVGFNSWLTGNDIRKATKTDLSYTAMEKAVQEKELNPKKPNWFGGDYVGRYMVLRNIQEKYQEMGNKLQKAHNDKFGKPAVSVWRDWYERSLPQLPDEHKKSTVPISFSKREVKVLESDDISKSASKRYKNDIYQLKKISDQYEKVHTYFQNPTESDQVIFNGLVELAKEINAAKEDHFRVSSSSEKELNPIVKTALDKSMERLLSSCDGVVLVSLLRTQPSKKPLASIYKFCNPYTLEGFESTGLSIENNYQINLKSSKKHRLVLVLRGFKGKEEYLVNFWHHTLSTKTNGKDDFGAPISLTKAKFPTFTNLVECRFVRDDGSAERFNVSFHDLKSPPLFFPAVLAGVHGSANSTPDVALKIQNEEHKTVLVNCLKDISFVPGNNPFHFSNWLLEREDNKGAFQESAEVVRAQNSSIIKHSVGRIVLKLQKEYPPKKGDLIREALIEDLKTMQKLLENGSIPLKPSIIPCGPDDLYGWERRNKLQLAIEIELLRKRFQQNLTLEIVIDKQKAKPLLALKNLKDDQFAKKLTEIKEKFRKDARIKQLCERFETLQNRKGTAWRELMVEEKITNPGPWLKRVVHSTLQWIRNRE
ncbi:MAG: hypothetical protein ACFCD0_16405 [Gemmataceae bacterium]